MSVFDDMGIYWAEIADQNQTKKQLKFIEKTLKVKGSILDVACGTGRHLIPLSQSGCDVIGLDISAKLLRIAKSRWSDAQVIRGDMRFLPFKPQSYSAAVSMDTSFGYLPNEQDDIQSLKALRETLSQNGVLIVDVFNRHLLIQKSKRKRLKWFFLPTLMNPNPLAKWLLFRFFKWKEYPSFFLLQKRTVIEKGKKLHDLWVVCDKKDGQIRVFEHSARLFEFKQLQGLLEKAGFKPNSVYGDYNGQSFSPSSSRLIFVANTI
jgi:SAM-dependent methyltransferase